MPQPPQERYAAKLLFQYAVTRGGQVNARRVCEERIIVLAASSARAALVAVKTKAADAQHRYTNANGDKVHFQFVGVMDLLHLGAECEQFEVWYEIKERVKPKERSRQLCPPEAQLNAIAWESGNPRRANPKSSRQGKK